MIVNKLNIVKIFNVLNILNFLFNNLKLIELIIK